MITALLAATFSLISTVELTPTDDIWAYPHAEDPMSDPYLRIWGQEGRAVWRANDDSQAYGISLMKFSLTKVDTSKALKSAKLLLTHAEGIAIDSDTSKKMPLEIRWVDGTFKERGWDYSQVEKLRPADDAKSIIATGFLTNIVAEAPCPMVIDLMAGPRKFSELYAEAIKGESPELRFALTSTIDPASLGRGAVYKFYSKDIENEKWRPVLKLEFAE